MMTEQQVLRLMRSSKDASEWRANCDHVKRECGGYPDFWYGAIILSGIAASVMASWAKPETPDIKIRVLQL